MIRFRELDELLAEAEEVLANADNLSYKPSLLLEFMVAIAKEMRNQ